MVHLPNIRNINILQKQGVQKNYKPNDIHFTFEYFPLLIYITFTNHLCLLAWVRTVISLKMKTKEVRKHLTKIICQDCHIVIISLDFLPRSFSFSSFWHKNNTYSTTNKQQRQILLIPSKLQSHTYIMEPDKNLIALATGTSSNSNLKQRQRF